MGKLTINNAVSSMINCDYNDVIRLAKWKVRKFRLDQDIGMENLHIYKVWVLIIYILRMDIVGLEM